MSDDRHDDDIERDADAPEAPPESGEPETPSGSPMGLDPEEVMRDPLGAMAKLMANPEAMQALQGFMNSPMARNLLSGGVQSPLFQQVLSQNPMLQSMLDQAGNRAGGLGNIDEMMKQMSSGGGFPFPGGGFPGGGFPGRAPTPPPPAPEPEEVEEEDEDENLDEPVIALLDPPHTGTPAYPDPAPVASLEALLDGADAAFIEAIAELAESRLLHHVGASAHARLGEKAQASGRSRASDLLLCQGAFAGELSWYAICRLEEDFDNASFVPLARHALACVTYHSGYRVPSFVNQLLAFLLEMNEAGESDLKHATWALSGQPGDSIEGVFEVVWSDAEDLLSALAQTPFSPRSLAAFAIALISWKELDPAERPTAASKMLAVFDDDAQRLPELYRTIALLLGGEEVEGVRAYHLPRTVASDLAEACAHTLGITETLQSATEHWPLEKDQREAHDGLLSALDVLWSEAEEAARVAYLDALIASEHEFLRARAYEVGAAWVPHDYLERAAEDSDPGIRRWATQELEALR